MKRMYTYILIGLVVSLWTIYFVGQFTKNKTEQFTPQLNGLYRPYTRNIRHSYEHFVNNYGPDVIANKLRKWNIY